MPERIRGVTPLRRTRVIINYPIPITTSPLFNDVRRMNEISFPNGFLCENTKFDPSSGWRLVQYHESINILHETAIVDSSVISGSVATLFQQNSIQRKPVELTGLGTTSIRTSGDSFFQKKIAASGTWDNKLSADQTAYPPPTEATNVEVDRVYVSTDNDDAMKQNWFRFYVPGSSGQTPVQIVARIYFSSLPSNHNDSAFDRPTGQYCVTIQGDAMYVLYEKLATSGTWKVRLRGRWCKPQNVVGRWHSIGIGSDVFFDGTNYQGNSMSLRFEDLDSDLTSFDSVKSDVFNASASGSAVVAPTNTYQFHNKNNWQPVLNKIRIDIRRDTRIKFQCYFGKYYGTGSIGCYAFSLLTYPSTTSNPIIVSAFGSFPTGTSVDFECYTFDGTPLTPVGLTQQGKRRATRRFTPVIGSTSYYVKIILNTSNLDISPIIRSMVYARDYSAVYSDVTPIEITGIGNSGVESISVSGEGRDFTTSTASVVLNDVGGKYASLLDNKANIPIKIEVDTLNDTGTVLSTTRVFEGRIVKSVKKNIGRRLNQGRNQTGANDAYAARFWGKYTLFCVGMWQILYDSCTKTLSDYANDPDVDLADTSIKSYKVGRAIEDLFYKSGWVTERTEVPDYNGSGVAANRFPIENNVASSLRIEPLSRIGPIIVDFARDYLGAYVTYDYNARKTGTVKGMFRVLLPPLPNPVNKKYRRLAAFRTTNTSDLGITTAQDRMPDVTDYQGGTCKQFWIQKDSLTEWVEPPEGNAVIVTGAGFGNSNTNNNKSATNPNGSLQLNRRIYNYQAANFGFPSGPPANFPQPDPNHPDYTDGRPVAIYVSNKNLQTQEAVDLAARRIFDYACHTKKRKSFAAPLWFITNPDDPYQVSPRPLKYGDIVTVDDEFFVVETCSYAWGAGEGNNQMMVLEVFSVPALDIAYTGNNNEYYKTISTVVY